jgi:5'-methylthioadenosine phosphorylase
LTLQRARLGLIGGSGLYDLAGLSNSREEKIRTPFGDPSDSYFTGELAGVPVVFLSRHGRGHRYAPTELNYRANICGLKMLGCDAILSASAVGSLNEECAPGHAVIPDQFLDRTRHRRDTFFSAGAAGLTVHRGGTYVCMEGPQFSTRAESLLYRSWGADVIGMTNLTEARLAREAEICYATLALVTDWDCWREATEDVSVEAVLAVLSKNADAARRTMEDAVSRVQESRSCACRDALRHAILTDPKAIPEAAGERLRPIAGRYL